MTYDYTTTSVDKCDWHILGAFKVILQLMLIHVLELVIGEEVIVLP